MRNKVKEWFLVMINLFVLRNFPHLESVDWYPRHVLEKYNIHYARHLGNANLKRLSLPLVSNMIFGDLPKSLVELHVMQLQGFLIWPFPDMLELRDMCHLVNLKTLQITSVSCDASVPEPDADLLYENQLNIFSVLHNLETIKWKFPLRGYLYISERGKYVCKVNSIE
jgi:hypothetical protein